MNVGRQLEQVVAFVEQMLVPKGFEVRVNRKEYDDDGNMLAEFDIEVRGKVGTGEIAWLIECRDRPSRGAAPGEWIEQLRGRQETYGFNKVTAVSTTGFSPSARQTAASGGIELREMKSIEPHEFSWMQTQHMVWRERLHDLKFAQVNMPDACDEPCAEEIGAILKAATIHTSLFVNSSGKELSIFNAFVECAAQLDPPPWDALTPASDPVPVGFRGVFPDHDPYFMVTSKGNIRVASILMNGALSVRDTLIPPETFKYQHATDGSMISELARFPVSVGDQKLVVEFHKIEDAENMQIAFRRVD